MRVSICLTSGVIIMPVISQPGGPVRKRRTSPVLVSPASIWFLPDVGPVFSGHSRRRGVGLDPQDPALIEGHSVGVCEGHAALRYR